MNKRAELINSVLTRYYYYWALVLFVVIGMLYWQLLFIKQYTVLQTSGVLRYDQLATTITQREQYLQDVQTMQTNFLALDHRLLQDLSVVLPDDYASAQVFSEIDQLFAGTALTVQSVNVSTLGAATANSVAPYDASDTVSASAGTASGLNSVYDIVSITVNVVATPVPGQTADASTKISYSDFKKVLRRLEQQRHLMNLEQIVYSPAANNFTLLLKTYQSVTPSQ